MNRHPRTDSTQAHLKSSSGSRRRFLLLVAGASLLTSTLLLAACSAGDPSGGGDGTSTTGPDGSIAHPNGASEIVLQVSVGGGFVPVEYNLTLVPQFSLYGDGRVIVPSPVVEIYPQPALPYLQTAIIPEESVQAVLSATREAGLFDPTFDYGRPAITDVGTTSFVINADGTTYRSDIYALGMESGAGGLTLEQHQARAAIAEFRGRVMDLGSFVTSEPTWEPFQYSALAVYSQAVEPDTTTGPTDIEPNRLEWPLGDLSTLGENVQPEGFKRVVISGQDLAALKPLLDQATIITLWESGGREYHLFFRPLLPEEAP